MSKGRKTISVSDILDMYDRFEKHGGGNYHEMQALRIFVETILFETGNYKGFTEPDGTSRRYLRNDQTRSTN